MPSAGSAWPRYHFSIVILLKFYPFKHKIVYCKIWLKASLKKDQFTLLAKKYDGCFLVKLISKAIEYSYPEALFLLNSVHKSGAF
jgi:hypothetical protein